MINIAFVIQEQHVIKQNIQKTKRTFGNYDYDHRNERSEGLEDKTEQTKYRETKKIRGLRR